MHRLFTIDSLIYEICTYVPRSKLPVLARVSSTWFRIAISLLYKENVRLEQALAPLGETCDERDGPNIKFVKSPGNEDFKRLLKYTQYVKVLEVDTFSTSIALKAIHKSLYERIPYLFPNTRSLKWYYPRCSLKCIEIIMALVSPKIEQLSLVIEDHAILRYFSSLLMTRLSALYSVHIRDETERVGDSTESSLVRPVRDLFNIFTRTLSFVHISFSLNTTSMARCLSKMPNLCNLTIGEFLTKSLERSSGICEDNARFPSLRSFSFDGPPRSFHSMFAKPYGLPSLTVLSLNAKISPHKIGLFISFIVTAYPRIQSLSLGERNYHDPSTYAWPVVPWLFIRPISRCKELSSLSFTWMRVSVSLEELTEFLKSRTIWTRLHILTQDPLHLQDILPYVEHCPNLEHLGLHIDDHVPLSVEGIPSNIPTFSTLDVIDFAYGSHIEKPSSGILAEFLYRICNKRLVRLHGLNTNILNHIGKSIADLYTADERKTGKLMLGEVRKFVERMEREWDWMECSSTLHKTRYTESNSGDEFEYDDSEEEGDFDESGDGDDGGDENNGDDNEDDMLEER